MNYIVLDTETTNGFDDPMVYDCGWSVISDNGETLATRSFVNADVFIDEPELMAQAYFADKIPMYIAQIADGQRTLTRFSTIRFALHKDCEKFNVVAIVAHNARFDYIACQTTQRYLTKSKYRWFFPYNLVLMDSLKMSKEVFGKDKDYLNFCHKNGYVCKNNQPRMTAEILYRYLSGDNNFVEAHCGLEDTLIEKEIFLECIRRNPTVAKSMWSK